MKRLVVGSRGSRLALVQTESVIARIRESNPGLEIQLKKIITSGDRDRHTQLDRMDVAVFVKELETALLERRIDLAVHSLKDLPTDIPPRLSLPAVMERADSRDVLIASARLNELAPGSRIGTGSLRRSVQLASYRPDLKIASIRGNVDTRLRKVASGEVDGIITAAAAIQRLGWENKITQFLPVEHFLPSAGQGALALEARIDDEETARIAIPLNHHPTWRCVTAERAFLKGMGGGCQAPVAALGIIRGYILRLDGMAAGPDGGKVLRAFVEGDPASPEELGNSLVEKMMALGAGELIGKH